MEMSTSCPRTIKEELMEYRMQLQLIDMALSRTASPDPQMVGGIREHIQAISDLEAVSDKVTLQEIEAVYQKTNTLLVPAIPVCFQEAADLIKQLGESTGNPIGVAESVGLLYNNDPINPTVSLSPTKKTP